MEAKGKAIIINLVHVSNILRTAGTGMLICTYAS